MLKNIVANKEHVVFGIGTFLLGIYLLVHHDYLDDPRVTWEPVSQAIRNVDYVDDTWFAVFVLLIGLGILVGVFTRTEWLRNGSMYLCAGLYMLFFVSFGIRGITDAYFNTTWAVDLIVACMSFFVASGGGGDNARI